MREHRPRGSRVPTGTLPAMTHASAVRTVALAVATAATAAGASGALAMNVQQSAQARCTKATAGFVVGDSVIDAINYLHPAPLRAAIGGGVVDGDVNRQFDQGAAVIKGRLAKSPRACAVVVALGTNGPVDPAKWSSLMRTLSRVPRVVVVNTYTKDWRRGQPWMPQLNATINALPKKYRNVRVANWAALAPSLTRTELPHGVHPDSPRAADKYTSAIVAALKAR